MRIRDIRNDVVTMPTSTGGIVVEANTGTLLRSSASDGNARIYRSTDDGVTWSLQQTMTIVSGFTGVRGQFVDSRGYIYFGGYTQTTYEAYTRFAELWQSKNDGVTWSKVCTAETSSFWHIQEDSSGRVYVNEYSTTPSSGTEYPALNIWRSDTAGDNFTKWHTATGESGQGLRDGVRHIHGFNFDSNGKCFVGYGDTGWTGNATKVVRLDSNGTIDLDYGTFGNGITSFLDSTKGTMIIGDDRDGYGVSIINATAALNCTTVHLAKTMGARYEGYIFELYRGHDNSVIYGWSVPPNANRYPFLIYSLDNGDTWGILYMGSATSNTCHINPNAPNKRIYFSGNTNRYVPDYTAAQLTKRSDAFVV